MKEEPSVIGHFCSKDFLITDDYIRHQHFYFTVLFGSSLSTLSTIFLLVAEPFFQYLYTLISYWVPIYYTFLIFTVINNLHQVYEHILTACKYHNINIVPYGSKNVENLMRFTTFNVLDIIGWFGLFVFYQDVHPFLALLAGAHFGSGLVSIFFNKTFQTYYLKEPIPKDVDTFKYGYWKLFKTTFVLTDAVVRGILTYYVLF